MIMTSPISSTMPRPTTRRLLMMLSQEAVNSAANVPFGSPLYNGSDLPMQGGIRSGLPMPIAKSKFQNERGRSGGLRGPLRNLWQELRLHPLLISLIVSLLLLIGLGSYSGIQVIRAEHQLRAARRALEQSDLNGARA